MSLLLIVGGSIGSAQAEPGSFFKNMFGGGGAGSGGADGTPTISGVPRLYDPNDAHCPAIFVSEGGSALPSYAGASGDSSRLRHQITLGRMSRECAPRPDGSVVVKVGVELRALLGPAGAPGRFDAPLTIAIKYGEKTVVVARNRKVPIAVAAGSAQGMASVVEDGLSVPASMADAFDIEVGLGNGRPKDPARTVKRKTPTSEEATAGTGEAPVAGQ